MYERIDHGNGQIEIREYFRSPMVYLDHWALNDISLDKTLCDRFVNVMNTKGGTLRLSVYNMIELSKQADSSQVPVSYCDIVMIDKRWKAFVTQTGFSYPDIAFVFDKKSLNEFFVAIETWKDTE